MNRSKKWLIAGAFIAFTSVAFTVSRYKGFMTADSHGLLLFIIALAAGISSCPAFGFVPDMKSKYYRLLAAAVFFAAPLFSVACVEILNGNFLFDLQDLFWMDNYVFCLAFYILLYGLTSSIRISVFVLQPLLPPCPQLRSSSPSPPSPSPCCSVPPACPPAPAPISRRKKCDRRSKSSALSLYLQN